MCGIYACISDCGSHSPGPELVECLSSRGPDNSNLLSISTQASSHPQQELHFTFFSTVLALRGGHVYAQPIVGDDGSILCWNGEAWSFESEAIPRNINDGQYLSERLAKAASISDIVISRDAVLRVFRAIKGPCAFVFFDKSHELIYFGRDCLGRRSLLIRHQDQSPGFVEFSSVSVPPNTGWTEVEADGIYVLDCRRALPSVDVLLLQKSVYNIDLHPWSEDESLDDSTHIGHLNSTLPDRPHTLQSSSPAVLALEKHLVLSLLPRLVDIPIARQDQFSSDARLAVLFSGGLDCTVLARMSHDVIPIEQSIDLLNVAFENPRVVEAARKAHQAKTKCCGAVDMSIPSSCFEACPDRMTGRNAFRELKAACPKRVWRFVEVNVPYAETIEHKTKVMSLIYPHNTEMDLSIGYALYFASRGKGTATIDDIKIENYTTTARVLLSGLGADELFGGYGRHAIAYERHGFQGLIEELDLDVKRLGKRNLGRDDRILSNWGRETRFPFLDEDLVNWALSSPVWEKCGFGNREEGDHDQVESDKKVLRLLAQRLNLPTVAREKKRAIQFGARTAKMETGKTKGTTLIS